MVIKSWVQTGIYAIILTSITLLILDIGFAQVRSSSNYQLQSDSFNAGGGLSSSTLYTQESTIGESATGPATSASYNLKAGYQQMQEIFLSLASTGDVTMSPDLPGLTGGTSNGSTTFTVITDSPSGYKLTIESENSPAMQSGSNSIADYDAGADPDFSFLIGGSDAYLGFSPEGVDVVQAFLDDGGTCNIGILNTPLSCWEGLDVSAVTISENTNPNHPSGATTTVQFRVGIGVGAGVIGGVYTATTTVTALPL